MHHALSLSEGQDVRDSTGPSAPLVQLRVFIATRPLFKRGRNFQPGETIALDEKTAATFLAAGDIKESE